MSEDLSVLRVLRAEIEFYLSGLVGRPFSYYQNGGNAGDSIIALGTLHCFERLGLTYQVIGPHSPSAHSTVVFAGGGNLIELYDFMRNGILKHLDGASRIIILPHTIRGNADLLQKFDSRVTIFCRDIGSYLHCKQHTSSGVRVFLGHDMAFHLEVSRILGDAEMQERYGRILEDKLSKFPAYEAKLTKRDPVNFFRLDAERAAHGLQSDMDVSEVFMGEISHRQSAEQSAWCFLTAIDRCKAGVWTDRLHVGLAAAMLGIPCRLFDNNYGKNKGIYQMSIAGRFPHVSFPAEASTTGRLDKPAAKVALSYCVTGQPHIIERLEASIADQLKVEVEAGLQCPYPRVLITDLSRSQLSSGMLDFFSDFVCDVDAFELDRFVNKRYFSLSKLRNAALQHASAKGFEWILLCDSDTVFADYRLDPPKSGFGVPEVYWQKSETEDIALSLARVRSPTKDTFSQGNSWFLISSALFSRILFNENIYGYGFEDMEYGARIAQAGSSIVTTDLRIIHKFHPEDHRAIDKYSHARNRALFEFVRKSIANGQSIDIREPMLSLPAQHRDWKGALILLPLTGKVVQPDQFTTGSFQWIDDVLKVEWDKFPAEFFKNTEGTLWLCEPSASTSQASSASNPESTDISTKGKIMASKADVALAYQLILGRPPENETVLNRFGGLELKELGEVFLKSPEFRAKHNQDASRNRFFPPATECDPISVETRVPDDIMDVLYKHVEKAWTHLGKVEPHYSVLTNDRFRAKNIAENSDIFYQSGVLSALSLRKAAARHGISLSQLAECFELGCGVGRVTLQLASLFTRVTAVDISAPHLELCRAKLSENSVSNVTLRQMESIRSLDVIPDFDAFYSVIVLQHNPPPVMVAILRKVLSKLRPGGIAFFQVPTYAKGYNFSVQNYLKSIDSKGPQMEMHVLPQSDVFRLADETGCQTLELREDGAVGGLTWLSNSFLLRKR